MSEKAPRPERQSKSLALIETNQREPRTIPTPYGEFAFVCHKGESTAKKIREEQQDTFVAVIDENAPVPKVSLAAIDGITLPNSGKEASLLLATEIKKSFLSGNLAGIELHGQKTMQTFGLTGGGAVFASLELSEQRVTWVGDVRVIVIYPDDTPPFTTHDHVNPDKRNQLMRQVGAAITSPPETTIINPPIIPGCKVVIMTDGAYNNLYLPVEFIADNVHAPIEEDTILEELEETQDAKTLAALLRPYTTATDAVRALNEHIKDSPLYPDNVTLGILYVDKKIPRP